MNVYNKLYYDICEVLRPGIQKTNFTYDSGKVSTYTKNYTASFVFNYQTESEKSKQLNLISFHGMARDSLFDFIEKIKNAELLVSIDDNGLLTRDISKCLFDVVKIAISDSIIDNTCIQIIAKYFPNLEEIIFLKCTINSDCSFCHINVPLYFEDCKIDNISVFHNCDAKLDLLRVNINKISPANIFSEKITIRSISNYQDINVYDLFLKCNFKKLKQLEIGYYNINNSFEKSFFYLPFSAPNLEEIFIAGKVHDLNFLTKFKYLREISIHSTEDDFGLGWAVVTDYKERSKLLKRNEEAYQIRKLLHPGCEKQYLIGELETERILRLCHFLSFLGYNHLSLDSGNQKIPYLLSQEVEDVVKIYYEYNGDILYQKKAATDFEAFFDRKSQYKMIKNFLYQYHPSYKSKIVLAQNFIYNQDSIPILFKTQKDKLKTDDAIKKMMEKRTTSYDIQNYQNSQFLAYLREYSEEDMPIECFIDNINEKFQIDINEDTFKDLEGSDEINKAFFQYNRIQQSKQDIATKQKFYQDDNVISSNSVFLEQMKRQYVPLIKEKEALESINQKTNNLYSKYQQYMKLTYKSYYTKTQDVEIKKSYIKKMKL